ncbi:MAG: LysR family transcriptional regulator substrate-binding protein [Clostridia bacterium]|nr:LysR family transcriptional regulator substrate-binding protein [Clostridia bacterium]
MTVENEFLNKMNDIYNLETGKIKVGGTNYMSSYIIPQIINKFAAEHPKIEVVLTDANSATLSAMLENEELDVVIDSFDESMNQYQGYPLLNEAILLCVPKDRSINDKLKNFQIQPESICDKTADLSLIDAVPIEMFKDEKFIMLKKGNDMYNRTMNVFSKNNIVPNVIFSVDQLNISYTLSESGMGLCFLTDTFFKYGKFHENVVLYKVESKRCTRTLYIVHKRNKYCSKAMGEFIKISKEVIHR